jgi:hypothetical protein
MVEDVVFLFESSLFHKIEKEIKDTQATFPNSSKETDSTTSVKKEDITSKGFMGNIDIPKEEKKNHFETGKYKCRCRAKEECNDYST